MERSLIFWWSSDILICASLILLWVLMLFLSRSSTVSYTVSPAEEETLPLKAVARDTTKNCKNSWEGDPFHVYFVMFLVDKNSFQILSYREIIHVTSNPFQKNHLLCVWNYRSVVQNLNFFSDHTATDSAAMATCDRNHNDFWLIYRC